MTDSPSTSVAWIDGRTRPRRVVEQVGQADRVRDLEHDVDRRLAEVSVEQADALPGLGVDDGEVRCKCRLPIAGHRTGHQQRAERGLRAGEFDRRPDVAEPFCRRGTRIQQGRKSVVEGPTVVARHLHDGAEHRDAGGGREVFGRPHRVIEAPHGIGGADPDDEAQQGAEHHVQEELWRRREPTERVPDQRW